MLSFHTFIILLSFSLESSYYKELHYLFCLLYLPYASSICQGVQFYSYLKQPFGGGGGGRGVEWERLLWEMNCFILAHLLPSDILVY